MTDIVSGFNQISFLSRQISWKSFECEPRWYMQTAEPADARNDIQVDRRTHREAEGQKDTTNVVGGFRDYANVPKNIDILKNVKSLSC